jgi:hypothetical protein
MAWYSLGTDNIENAFQLYFHCYNGKGCLATSPIIVACLWRCCLATNRLIGLLPRKHVTILLRLLCLLLLQNPRDNLIYINRSIFIVQCHICNRVKRKVIPATSRGGPWNCETSRLPHFLNKRLTDGDEVDSLNSRPAFTPRNIPGTHFC